MAMCKDCIHDHVEYCVVVEDARKCQAHPQGSINATRLHAEHRKGNELEHDCLYFCGRPNCGKCGSNDTGFSTDDSIDIEGKVSATYYCNKCDHRVKAFEHVDLHYPKPPFTPQERDDVRTGHYHTTARSAATKEALVQAERIFIYNEKGLT